MSQPACEVGYADWRGVSDDTRQKLYAFGTPGTILRQTRSRLEQWCADDDMLGIHGEEMHRLLKEVQQMKYGCLELAIWHAANGGPLPDEVCALLADRLAL